MKTIHLNLAAKPYRDYRMFYSVLGAAGLVALVLMVYNVMTAVRYLVETRDTRAQITALDAEAARQRATAEAMEQRIATIDAVSLDKQARFINMQIRERAFSWSGMMGRLEALLPGDVRLTNLNPNVSEDGTIALSLDCVSRRQDGLVVLLERLYSNPAFKNSFPANDSTDADGSHRITINTTYLPAAEEVKK